MRQSLVCSRVVIAAFVMAMVGTATLATSAFGVPRAVDGTRVREFAVPSANSEPHGIVASPSDGSVWFTEQLTDRLGRISHGRITEVPIPGSTVIPTAIAADAAGDLWFIESGARVIGRYSPADGTFATFTLPGRYPQMSDLAVASDGSVWFTEGTNNRVGRLDPATGAVDLFRMPKRNVWPQSITAGPDGNMWFTTVGWVGRVTLDGVVTFFPVSGDPTPQLDGIAVGSDGILWFTEVFPDAMVGRITTDGTVTRFPLPDGASFPGAVAACPGATDPSLYVTDSSADALFQVRTDGTSTTIPIPTADAWPMGVTCGVDGRIWFAEWAADQIGRLVP